MTDRARRATQEETDAAWAALATDRPEELQKLYDAFEQQDDQDPGVHFENQGEVLRYLKGLTIRPTEPDRLKVASALFFEIVEQIR